MIRVAVGKPRNGKSLRACMEALHELLKTHRFIVTNMAFDLDAVQDYCDQRGGKFHVRDRLLMLTDEETKEFWRYREFGVVLPRPDRHDQKDGANYDYSPIFTDRRFFVDEAMTELRGTFYIIDEVHTHWPARGWQGTPRHVDFYNSQHGKLNDKVWFITQNTKLVDPNFYRLAQDFMYCRNHRLIKHGRFRGFDKFVGHIYDGPATTGKEPTLNVEEWKLDLEVANCYDTSAGVGMPGGGKADGAQRTKGLPLWTVWVGLAAALAVAWVFFSYGLPRFTNGLLVKGLAGSPIKPPEQRSAIAATQPASESDAKQGEESASRLQSPPLPPRPQQTPVLSALDPVADRPDRPRLRGYVARGNRVNVVLSDGRTLTERDEVWSVRRNAVVVAGQTFYMTLPADRPIRSSLESSPNAEESNLPAEVTSTQPPPPPEPVSSWQTHSDGVSRLTEDALSMARSSSFRLP